MLRSLKIEDWPVADRDAWHSALRPRAGWKRGGAASGHRAITNADLQRRYGYFLQFCLDAGAFESDAPLLGHVTEANALAYVKRVETIWASITVHTTVQKLWKFARVLAPDHDWAWLHEIVRDLKAVAEPSIFRPTLSAKALMDLGILLHEQGVALL